MQKVVLVAFNGEMMCFVHVLLNALDMKERGMEVAVIFEGASVKLVPELVKEENAFHSLFTKALKAGLIAGACKACSSKLGVLEGVEEAGLALLGGMLGHPPLGEYLADDWTVLTF